MTDDSRTEIKTYGDWRNAGFAMVWSIFKDYPEDDDINAAILDFSAPEGLPNGEYRIRHEGYGRTGDSIGAIVRDGEFEPISTEVAVLRAVALTYGLDPVAVEEGREGLDYRFIESFRWNEESGYLEVGIGS